MPGHTPPQGCPSYCLETCYRTSQARNPEAPLLSEATFYIVKCVARVQDQDYCKRIIPGETLRLPCIDFQYVFTCDIITEF